MPRGGGRVKPYISQWVPTSMKSHRIPSFSAFSCGPDRRNRRIRGNSVPSPKNRGELGLAFYVIAPLEAFHAACGVHEMLLAGIEGMALGADFHPDVLRSGLGLYYIPARACDGRDLVCGMCFGFHVHVLQRFSPSVACYASNTAQRAVELRPRSRASLHSLALAALAAQARLPPSARCTVLRIEIPHLFMDTGLWP